MTIRTLAIGGALCALFTCAAPVSAQTTVPASAVPIGSQPVVGLRDSRPPAPSAVESPAADFNSCLKPEYPRSALRKEETGTVTMAFLISKAGAVLESKVVKSSGSEALDMAALEAISKCRFRPARANNVTLEAWATVQYVWQLG